MRSHGVGGRGASHRSPAQISTKTDRNESWQPIEKGSVGFTRMTISQAKAKMLAGHGGRRSTHARHQAHIIAAARTVAGRAPVSQV